MKHRLQRLGDPIMADTGLTRYARRYVFCDPWSRLRPLARRHDTEDGVSLWFEQRFFSGASLCLEQRFVFRPRRRNHRLGPWSTCHGLLTYEGSLILAGEYPLAAYIADNIHGHRIRSNVQGGPRGMRQAVRYLGPVVIIADEPRSGRRPAAGERRSLIRTRIYPAG